MSGTHGRTLKSGRVSTKTRSSYSSKRDVDEKILHSAAHSPWDGLSLRQQVTPSAVDKIKQHPYPVYLDIDTNAQHLGDDSGDLEHFDSKYVEGFGAQFDGERVNNPPLTSFARDMAPASRDIPGVGDSKDLLFTLQNNRKLLSRIPAKSRGDPALFEAHNAGKKKDDVGPKSGKSPCIPELMLVGIWLTRNFKRELASRL